MMMMMGKKSYTESSNRLSRGCRGILALLLRREAGCGSRRRRLALALLLLVRAKKKMMVLRPTFPRMSARLA